MLDPIALLQSLTLPAGALSGARIVLDGTTGTISIYSAANNLLMTLDGSGFKVYDTAAKPRTQIGIPGLFSSITLATGDASETGVGPGINSQASSSGPALSLESGDWGKGFPQLNLKSPKANTDPALLQFISGFLTGGLQPVVDLTGDATNIARVVLDDLWKGNSLGNGNNPSQTRRIGQGLIPGSTSGTITSNVTGSATNGTVVDILALLGVPVRNGFIYRIEARGYTAVTSGNASATSQWEIEVDVDDGGGRVVKSGYKFNANVAADVRVGIPAIVAEFIPSADGNIDIRATITKNSGTAAATLQTQNDATHPFTLRCYHVG